VYLVLVLEILKLKRWRQFQLRRENLARGKEVRDEEIDAEVARELETGDFEAGDVRAAVAREEGSDYGASSGADDIAPPAGRAGRFDRHR
jgi:hypothetical protein